MRLVSARNGLQKLAGTLDPRAGAVVFLTVPDSAVGSVAAKLAGLEPAVPLTVAFVHTSGALELSALAPLSGSHSVGSFHPLRSFPQPGPPEAFRRIVVAVDASSASLLRVLKRLARDVGAKPRRVVDADRALYHAAAVFASNYLVALLGEAVGLLEESGWTEDDAVNGLVALAQGAVANVAKRGPTLALTGPIRRGDSETVARHLAALGKGRLGARRRGLYRMLGEVALEIAREAGLEPLAAEQTRRALTREVAATRRRPRR